jgi:kynurenine formamidase
MRTGISTLFVAIIATICGYVSFSKPLKAKPPETNHAVSKADIDRWKVELSNWGRWGKDDQIGTLNLITPDKRVQAAKLVKEGFSVSLAQTALIEKADDNPFPYAIERYDLRDVGQDVAMDGISVRYHGSAHTHFDAMDHVYKADGKAYNGYAFDHSVATSKEGHPRNTVINIKNGVFTRGILIDIPRLKGVPYLEPGTRIYVEDIEAWEKKAGVKVSAGDALFIRTGRWARREALGPWKVPTNAAGLDPSVIPWLKQRDIATLGSDVSQKVSSPSLPDLGLLGNVHDFALSVLGIHLFDNCNLESLGDAAAARHRWEFLLTAAPLPIPGGTGSPINPIATF